MKAFITMTLTRPTRMGNRVVAKKIIAKKDVIVDEVNQFIVDRVNKDNYIPVSIFKVKIYDYKNREIRSWQYIPTQRNLVLKTS